MDVLFVEAKKEAATMRADLIKQAEADALEIKDKNKKLLEEEKSLLYREVKDKIIKTSLMIVENTLKRFVGRISKEKSHRSNKNKEL